MQTKNISSTAEIIISFVDLLNSSLKIYYFQNLPYDYEKNPLMMQSLRYDFGLDIKLLDYSDQFESFSSKNKSKLPIFVCDYLQTLRDSLIKSNHDFLLDEHLESNLFLSDVIIDYSWEMLNTNLWTFVDDIYRLIYAYGTLYKIVYLNIKLNCKLQGSIADEIKTDQETINGETLTKLCDLGLLMLVISGFFFSISY
jgi:hypothetical protein